MNEIVEEIWDVKIKERLKQGDINVEMDIQTIFRSELESKLKTEMGIEKFTWEGTGWRCYHDLLLLKSGENKSERYDMVLMKYEDEETLENHYPAIVVEFKCWNSATKVFDIDYYKLQELISGNRCPYDKRPFAVHLMYVIDVKNDKFTEEWENKVFRKLDKSFELKTEHFGAESILNLKTKLAQWGRYKGDVLEMPWYCTSEVRGRKRRFENRKIYMIRVSKKN